MIPRMSGVCTDAIYQNKACFCETQKVRAGRADTRETRSLAMMTASFDMQLGESFLQRCLDGRDFFGAVIFFHRGLGTLDGGLGRGQLRLCGFNRRVCRDFYTDPHELAR